MTLFQWGQPKSVPKSDSKYISMQLTCKKIFFRREEEKRIQRARGKEIRAQRERERCSYSRVVIRRKGEKLFFLEKCKGRSPERIGD